MSATADVFFLVMHPFSALCLDADRDEDYQLWTLD